MRLVGPRGHWERSWRDGHANAHAAAGCDSDGADIRATCYQDTQADQDARPTAQETPTPAPTSQPTSPPITLNDGNETTWTSKQTRDQPQPTPSPVLDTAYSTLEIRFKVFEDQVTRSAPNRDSSREVDVDVNSNESKVTANGNIKIIVTLTNGRSARGSYVFTVTQINGDTLKGTYQYTGPTGGTETGSFTMTHS